MSSSRCFQIGTLTRHQQFLERQSLRRLLHYGRTFVQFLDLDSVQFQVIHHYCITFSSMSIFNVLHTDLLVWQVNQMNPKADISEVLQALKCLQEYLYPYGISEDFSGYKKDAPKNEDMWQIMFFHLMRYQTDSKWFQVQPKSVGLLPFMFSQTPAIERLKGGQTYHPVIPSDTYPPPNWKKDDDNPSLCPTPDPPSTSSNFRYCSFCERQVATTIELQPTFLSFFVGLLMFLMCGWIAFCILPFIWPLLQVRFIIIIILSDISLLCRVLCIIVPSVMKS